LGTADEKAATNRAHTLNDELQKIGWVSFCSKHPREFVAAVFWLDRPVVSTYATFFTGFPPLPAAPRRAEGRQIFLVEPDDSVRAALARWIGRQPGAALLGFAAHAAAAFADDRLPAADVVLFNRFLPDAAVEEFRTRLKAVAPNAHAFPIGTYAESDDIFKSVSGVTEGYYLRRRPPGSWLEPIEGSQGGRSPTGVELTRHLRGYFAKLINGETRDPAVEGIRFTGREQQILHCLQKGMPDKEIAQELRMSPLTVHTHLKHIFEKLGAHTRTEAVMKFLQK
jgi:DNA-binding NarL/FixJ family response regulator